MGRFQQNLELDARCVAAAAKDGLHGMLGVALAHGCPSPDEAIDRAKWLKRQPKAYIQKVSDRVVELLDSQK